MAFLAACFLAACAPYDASEDADTSGPVADELPLTHSAETAEMVSRLRELARTVDPFENRFANTARLAQLEAADLPEDPGRRLAIEASRAEETLRSGRFDEAIAQFERLLVEIQASNAVPPAAEYAVTEALATAHLRRAEQKNCVEARRMASCTMPIPEGESFPDPADARIAADLYRRLLDLDPSRLDQPWLLNLAHMMIGDYPDAVPEQWLMPRELFDSEMDFPRFPEIAAEVGLDMVGNVGGAVMDDFDGDLDLDILASSWALDDPLWYYENTGGQFVDRTVEAGVAGLLGGGNIVQADYDNDGDLDALVLRGGWLDVGYPNSLLRNRGDGTFEDATASAGLLDPIYPSQAAAWADFDRDGWLDLFVGNETFRDEPHPTQLFMNNRDGTFTERTAEFGAGIVGVVKAVVAGDYDSDGYPDLYLSGISGPNTLLRNVGDGPDGWAGFENVTGAAGVAEPRDAFSSWFWDYDNDGRLDLFVAGYRTRLDDIAGEYQGRLHGSELPRLYRGAGDGELTDVTAGSGLDRILFAMGLNTGDLNGDGFADVFIGTGDPVFQALIPNRVLVNRGDGTFAEVTTAGGFGQLAKGHAVAFGDFDHDGDQDVFQSLGGAYEGDLGRSVLFENPGFGTRWISLLLEGVESNRSAIGAKIEVVVEDATGSRTIIHHVGSGGSFGGNTLRAEIGLGTTPRILRATITWPLGRMDELEGLTLDTAYRVREGDPPVAVELPSQR